MQTVFRSTLGKVWIIHPLLLGISPRDRPMRQRLGLGNEARPRKTATHRNRHEIFGETKEHVNLI